MRVPETIPLEMDELERLLERLQSSGLEEQDYELLRALVESYVYLTWAIQDKGTKLAQLRQLLFGSPASEKTKKVLEEVLAKEEAAAAAMTSPEVEEQAKPKPKGHGRNGANAYRAAERIEVPNESLRAQDCCPECPKGRLYKLKNPKRLVRLTGQAPIHARIYELEKLRCNLCGEIFSPETPEGVGEEKYDAKSASMIGILRYGTGVAFNRLEKLQGNLGIPLPSSTQWDIVNKTAKLLEPVYAQLITEAAQGDVMYNDDTRVPILELIEQDREQTARGSPPDRTGMFTSGIVSTTEGRQIALYFTGRKHAGENLSTVLAERASELGPLIQMCDGLDRNLPKGLPEELKVIVSNCMAHARRNFVKVVENFPAQCQHVLVELGKVYKTDAVARQKELDPEDRLVLHQRLSGPVMKALKKWLAALLEDQKVEPNSGLGQAIKYALKRWDRLTLFLREPGAPLDNNRVERVLKKAILHRKNSLFYKTEVGAKVGDLFMSLIATCELHGVNPLDYLTELQNHASELQKNPAAWMPWNYQATIEGLAGD